MRKAVRLAAWLIICAYLLTYCTITFHHVKHKYNDYNFDIKRHQDTTKKDSVQ